MVLTGLTIFLLTTNDPVRELLIPPARTFVGDYYFSTGFGSQFLMLRANGTCKSVGTTDVVYKEVEKDMTANGHWKLMGDVIPPF